MCNCTRYIPSKITVSQPVCDFNIAMVHQGLFDLFCPISKLFSSYKSRTEISPARSQSLSQPVCDLAINMLTSTDLYPFRSDSPLLKAEQKYPQQDHSHWDNLSVIWPTSGDSLLILTHFTAILPFQKQKDIIHSKITVTETACL